MTPEEVVSQVFGVGRHQVHDATSNTTLAEWDSLGHVNLILELEAVYDISLSPDDVLRMTNVALIKSLLQSRGVSW
jgi:acyl carrier protein